MWQFWIEKAYAYSINVPISGDKKTYTTFGEYVVDLVKLAINIAGSLAILMIVYGAYKYLTSGGDDSKAKEGKDIIVGALVGFALLVLIRVIVPIIGIQ